MASPPRLYIQQPLHKGASIVLEGGQAHYLSRVMRLRSGDEVRVFNGRDGEWRAALGHVSAKRVEADLRFQSREQPTPSSGGPRLLFAPLKKTRTDFVIEKATELGVSRIQPVITTRTQTRNVRVDRLRLLAIEAAEQTERMDVPEIEEAGELGKVLERWPIEMPLYYCDEAGNDVGEVWGGQEGKAPSLLNVAGERPSGQIGLLVGPEGGFSPEERTFLRSLDFVNPVTLGPRILRAETAVAAALAVWQAVAGDWRDKPDAGSRSI